MGALLTLDVKAVTKANARRARRNFMDARLRARARQSKHRRVRFQATSSSV
jgi:hypothetical protein